MFYLNRYYKCFRKRDKYSTASITFPLDIIKRNNLKNKDNIVICYLCKEGEDVKQLE